MNKMCSVLVTFRINMEVLAQNTKNIVVRIEDGLIVKIPLQQSRDDVDTTKAIYSRLRELDPEGLRYGNVRFDMFFNVLTPDQVVGIGAVVPSAFVVGSNEVMVSSQQYLPLARRDYKHLTREQYMHLARSIAMLREARISHNDLLDNVMLHPQTNMPVIIDFDESKIHVTDATVLNMDTNTLLHSFGHVRPNVPVTLDLT